MFHDKKKKKLLPNRTFFSFRSPNETSKRDFRDGKTGKVARCYLESLSYHLGSCRHV